jgi:tRNA(His) 5'-end guanylyltransferase
MFFSASKFGELSDEQKKFENDTTVDLEKPVVVRIDGRAFHTFTRGLVKPYDEHLGRCMIETAKHLVEKFMPTVGYVQSDEITLIFCNTRRVPFSGRCQKLASLIASTATAFFNNEIGMHIPAKRHMLPVFDGRIFNVKDEAAAVENVFWRSCDAVRNSVFAAAFSQFSAKQLHKKNVYDQLNMLASERQIDWITHYPTHFKFGTLVTRELKFITFSAAELLQIPEKYRPTGPVLRSCIKEYTPPFNVDERKDFIQQLFFEQSVFFS